MKLNFESEKLEKLTKIKKSVTKKTKVILNFEKYNTSIRCYFFTSGVLSNP